MSLTSFIKKSNVRNKIDKIFSKPSFSQNNLKIKAKPPETYSGKDYMLIGTAFDYLYRFYLKYNYKEKVKDSSWVAHTSLYKLMYCTVYSDQTEYKKSTVFFAENPDAFLKGMKIELEFPEGLKPPKKGISKKEAENLKGEQDIIYNNDFVEFEGDANLLLVDLETHLDNLINYFKKDDNFNTRIEKQVQKMFNYILNAEKIYGKYIEEGEMTEEVIKAVIDLAKIDDYYRGGKFNKTLGEYKRENIKDLKKLYEAIPRQNDSVEQIILNPNFGEGSKLVGGADADLIFNNTLIDIKTTKKLSFSVKYWRQLVGYLTLIDFQNKFKINEAGIYFSRYGYFYTFNADEVYNEEGYEDFKKWFVREAKDSFR